jgi:DNA repair photolyase
MTIRRKKYEDWLKVKPRKDVIPSLEKDIKKLTKNSVTIKDIFLGSITDSYQPMEYTNKLTRQIIEVLKQNELPFTILTKNDLVLRDIDLFKHYKLCRIGVTITSFDEDFRRILEPFSVSYAKRVAVLEALKANGISTYLSCEPIFPVKEADPISIVKELRNVVDLFEFGMWNKYRTQGIPEYYYKHYNDEYYADLFNRLTAFCNDNKVSYCLASHSREFIERLGLRFGPYPTVKP